MYVFKATQLDLESGLALYPQVSAQFDIQVLRLNRSICHIHERISDSFSRSLTSHFFLEDAHKSDSSSNTNRKGCFLQTDVSSMTIDSY